MENTSMNYAPATVESALSHSEAQQTQIKEDLQHQQQRVNELYRELLHQRNVAKALRHLSKVTPTDESVAQVLSEYDRKKFSAISPQIRALIVRHVYYDG